MTDTLRLFAFNTGWFQCRPGYFIEGEEGDYLKGPVPSYLIDHPKGRALFDTGMGVRYRRTLADALPPNKFGLHYFEGQEIAARLKGIDVDPGSIDWVINSHLHIDHCGGNASLPNATMIVQSRELAAAQATEEAGLYEAVDYATGQPVKAIDGELDLFGDGSVRIVPTYGHTPGHQSVIVMLPSGREMLLAADCCYTERNLDLMILQKAVVDREAGERTMAFLDRRRRDGAYILFGHDGRQWAGVEEGKPLI
ncbi:MAG: N-acyl homoserine lactonase family protein [Sphingomonadales bacterium]|nr:N-acyl homoserine lactonase family protein [Sphingomonadales bacterium]